MVEDDTHPPGYFIPRRSELQIAILQQQVRSLQDFIELKLTSTRELLDARWAADMKALKIGSDELARRLDILNHAHQEALRVQQTYIPRETYAVALEEIRKKQEENVVRISTLETSAGVRDTVTTSYFGRTLSIVGLFLGIPGLIVSVIVLVWKVTT